MKRRARSATRGAGSPPGARAIAAGVVGRVLFDDAWAAAALDAALAREPGLDVRERALATELVYGTLRLVGAIRTRLERHAARGLPSDPLVLPELLVASYQILVLERVPAFAAVDAAVGAIRGARGAPSAGFANAVLRRLADGGERLDRAEAALESVPGWLRERIEASIGREAARELLGAHAAATEPAVAVRVVANRELPDWLQEAEPGRASPLARRVTGGGDLRRREGYSQGAFTIQEEGSQLVALALGARAGERVLDACAGRGGKATLLAERIAPGGELWAADLHAPKLEALVAELARLGMPPARTAAVDWSVGPGNVPGDFDRVLVDAPCTGTGTLRRRPEIALRVQPEDPSRLAALAERILRGAASRARPGGRVVFAVCSVLREECEDVVERVSSELEPVPFDAPELTALALPATTSLRLLPSTHGTDAYFVASLRRRA